MEKADTNASSPIPYQWVRASKRKYQSNILILMMADLKYVVLAFSPVRVFSRIFPVCKSKYSVVRHNFHFSFATKRSPPRKTMKWIIHFINGSDALSCFWPNHYYFILAYIHVPTTLRYYAMLALTTEYRRVHEQNMEMWTWLLFRYDYSFFRFSFSVFFFRCTYTFSVFFLFEWFGIILIINLMRR